MHAVTRLARFAVANSVRQHDEKFRRIERLIFSKEFAGKLGRINCAPLPVVPCMMRIGIRRFALRILLRFSQRPIMEAQLRQCFA